MIEFEEKIYQKKTILMNSIIFFINSKTKENLIDCIIKGNEYFNLAESIVKNSKIKGKHNDGLWVTDLAESCEEILRSYIKYINFIKSHNGSFQLNYESPKSNSCSSMQRMVKNYLPKEIHEKLREEFLDADLPTRGFDMNHSDDVEPKSKLLLFIGLFFALISMIVVLLIKDLNSFQMYVIRCFFAFGLTALLSYVPGLIKIDISNGKIKAFGAVSFFIVFYFFNPPVIQ
jgi:hypothetical protein